MSIKTNRSIVGILGITGILFFIWLGSIWFALFITAVMLLALFEYYQIAKLKDAHPIIWIGLAASLFIAYFYYYQPKIDVFSIIVAFIMVALFIELFRNKPNSTENFNITIGGILYIPLLVGTLIGIRNFDTANATNFTFALFISIWICDSAAYYTGKYFGKKKIYPRVSPNKTVVGSTAGLIFAFITYMVMDKVGFIKFDLDITQIIILSVISGVFGQAGDFVESLFKRDANVKDSGVLLLGHGGVLDRFDSLIIASPLVFIFLNLYY